MKCKEAKLKTSLALDGRLSRTEAAELEAHMAECSCCRAESAVLDEITTSLESLEASEPCADGWERIAAQIEPPRPRRSLVPAFGLACVLILAVIAAFLFIPKDRTPQIADAPKPKKVNIVKKTPPEAPKVIVPKDVVAPEPVKQVQPSMVEVVTPPTTVPKKTATPNRHKPAPVKPKPAPKPKPIPTEEPAPQEEYIAEVPDETTVPESNEISAQADGLLARGLSVLVQASAELEREGGENL